MARDIRKEGLDSIGEDEILSTGQVIKLTGISEGSIRKYEDKGLLEVEQTGKDVSNNRRRWRKDDIHQLGRIKALLAYGFKLDEVKLIFNGDADAVEVLLSISRSRTRTWWMGSSTVRSAWTIWLTW